MTLGGMLAKSQKPFPASGGLFDPTFSPALDILRDTFFLGIALDADWRTVAEIVGVIDYRSHRRDDMADPGIGGRIRVKLLAKVAYQFRRDSGDRQ